jgi:hypothetical protein
VKKTQGKTQISKLAKDQAGFGVDIQTRYQLSAVVKIVASI